MKKIILILCIIILAIFIISALMPKSPRYSWNKSYNSTSYNAASVPSALSPALYQQAKSFMDTTHADDVSLAVGQYVTRTVSMMLIAEDTEKVFAEISQLTQKYNGTIQYSSISGDTTSNRSANLTLTIPEKQADTMIAAIHDLNVEVDSETTTLQTIKTNYIDAQSRLDAQQAIETQYLQILKNSKTVPDVLAVTEKLSIVRANIESLKSQIKLLNQQINYVTINISIRTAPVAEHWSIWGEVGAAALFLVITLVWLGMASIWFLFYILPLLLLIAVVYFIVRFFTRKKK